MYVSYKKLRELLTDKDTKKKDLMTVVNISTTSISKLTKGKKYTDRYTCKNM